MDFVWFMVGFIGTPFLVIALLSMRRPRATLWLSAAEAGSYLEAMQRTLEMRRDPMFRPGRIILVPAGYNFSRRYPTWRDVVDWLDANGGSAT